VKTRINNLFILLALFIGLGLTLAGSVTAQTLTTLHNFVGYPTDGGGPEAGLILSSNILYGTTVVGGISNGGTMFVINTDGTGYSTRHNFTGPPDGGLPYAGLVLSSNTLYGTTSGGGSINGGTVFAVNTDGTSYTNLHSFIGNFVNTDGAGPYAGLILSGNTLYGTTRTGGGANNGTVFAINTDGTGYTNLYFFSATSGPNSTNSDGAYSVAGLILSDGNLYGTTQLGGSSGYGTVFKVGTDGTGFTTLYNFTNGSDGANPLAGLILSGNTLFGTASQGGISNYGTVFAINTDGTGFTTLHSFVGAPSDGQGPHAGLILSGNTLFGTTRSGGSDVARAGTVFAINTNGTDYAILHNFTGSKDGALPDTGLILSGNTLYGTTTQSTGANGTVFSLSLAPQLTIIHSAANVVLTWPTNVAGFDYTGFTLQSTTNLVSPAVWITNSPAPVVVNGQNTVTNPISSSQMFYRLSQ